MNQLLSIVFNRRVGGLCPCPGAGVCLLLGILFALLPTPSQSQNIVISEIMYHGAPAFEAGTTNVIDGVNFDYLELLNTGGVSVDLQGMSITQAVDFTFTSSVVLPPGGRYVIAEDPVFFQDRYGSISNLAPQAYSGKLNNSGEWVFLTASNGVDIFSVRYRDDSGWPVRADGAGPSLVLVNTAGDPNVATNWAAHDRLYGNPGGTDAVYQVGVLLNEILAHTDPPLEDAVELYNTLASPVPINGWYLSDDQKEPRKYLVTNGPISASSFHVFYEYQFNTNALFDTNNVPFGLSELGDEVYLTAPGADTNDLRLIDYHEFDATANGVSLGRYPDGESGFFVLSAHSFGVSTPGSLSAFRTGTGAPNATPANPTVVINEIMYHPVQTNELAYEYIELHNTTASSIDVSGWTYGGIQFTNPPGTLIPAGGYLVVAADKSTLEAHHGITGVVGDWAGQLSNSGEKVQLFDDELVLVDEVDYRDGRPWSTGADGLGPSLERVQTAGPSDTPVNWRASMGNTNWQQVVWNQNVSPGGVVQLRMWLDFEGKCWVDDVSVTKDGGGGEEVSNPGFESGMTDWGWSVATNNHRQSRVETGIGRSGTNALVLVGNFSRHIFGTMPNPIQLVYGDLETNHVASAEFTLASGNHTMSCWVKRQGVGGTFHVSMNGASAELDLGHEGTPGTENTVHSSIAPIGITSVDKDFSIVEVSSTNVIRADVESAAGVSSVTFHYRPVSSNDYQYTDVHYSSLPMSDNGIAPDLIAGDGEYALALAFATNRHIIRYHVTAVASNGMQTRSPQIDDQSDDFGYWVESSPVETNLPNWHVFFDGAKIRYPNSVRTCAVSSEGQVFTDVRIRHRGRASSNPASSTFTRGGVALRLQDDRRYDAWFADNRDAINFRQRENDSYFYYRRVVNEWLAYELQREVGLVTPHYRHVCIWLNGAPTITGELEAPDFGFMDIHELSEQDYVSRAGYTGRIIVDGDEALDNFNSVHSGLSNLSSGMRISFIRTNIWYESVRYSVAFENLIGNGDQHLEWNMFQHRRATNGLWAQYPWDLDMAFNVETNKSDTSTGAYLPELHPYYETEEHPSIWDDALARPMGRSLFMPETAPSTLPYRYRQQMTLWRWYHTLFTTNHLFSKLDVLEAQLTPAYQAIQPYTGVSESILQTKISEVKNFIELRRDFLHDGEWSGWDTNIWNAANVYDPSQVVINEVMYNPLLGGEYIELANASTQTIDLSWWELTSGNETYHLPHGTMLGPTSFLVVADTQWELTNSFAALSDSASVIHRYQGIPIWDHPITFLSATEYASRIVEIPQITLPGDGASIRLTDLTGTVIDEVEYAASSPWPAREGYSLELLDPSIDNSTSGAWRTSFVLGTPGYANSATNDMDGDQLLDAFEELVIAFYAGVTDLSDVNPGDNQDGDAYSIEEEFLLGLDPTLADGAGLEISIQDAGLSMMTVDFPTFAVGGGVYTLFTNRLYTLETSTNLMGGSSWTAIPTYLDVIGLGQTIIYTNLEPSGTRYYRYDVELDPIH